MCPFCYIGKRKFERALEQFPHKDKVEIIWKSFQLNPALITAPDKNVNQYLAEIKGWPLERAEQMNDYVTSMAKEVGLTYNFNKAIVANSFDAHRFTHLAKTHSLQDKAEERLFAAYFTEGKNTADHNTLIQLGTDIGLDAAEVRQMLESSDFVEEVNNDIYEAQQVGVSGVPFFMIGDQYAISEAHESSIFLEGLKQGWKEFEDESIDSRSSRTPESVN